MSRLPRSEFTVTAKGIVIGGAYLPPPRREIGSEAEKVQRVLLAPIEVGRRPLWWSVLRALRMC